MNKQQIKENFRNYLIGGTANKVVLAITLAALVLGIRLLLTAPDVHHIVMAVLLIAPFLINTYKSLFHRKGQ